MENFKNFALGGLYQSGQRMAPPWGAFRRFTNTFKDQTKTLKPYGRGEEVANGPVLSPFHGVDLTHLGPVSSQYYKKGIFQFHAMNVTASGNKRGLFSYISPDGTMPRIMQPFTIAADYNLVDINKHATYMPSGNYSSCTVNRKAFVNSMVNTSEFVASKPVNGFTPEESWLMTFDGLRTRGAGLPLPWTSVDSGGAAGAHYARIVYATIGMDGEVIFSPYLQQRLSSATRDVYTSGYSAYPGTRRADVVGPFTFPTYRRPEDHLFEEVKTATNFGPAGSNQRYFDKRYIKSTGVATIPASGEMNIVSADRSGAVENGDWIMVELGSYFGTIPSTLYMFQVKSTNFGSVDFEKNFKYLDQNSVTWIDANFQDVVAEWNTIDVDIKLQFLGVISGAIFTNIFSIISYSTTASSGYVVHDILPVAWDSVTTFAGRVLSAARAFPVPWCGVVSSLFADWYDANAVKTTFPPMKGITNYKELLVGFDANAIYFSDITLGGSSEMVSGLSNIVPFGSEFGDIVAVCGSEDFLLISRERKNYILIGDIAGSSFSLDECDLPVAGAYNSKCVSNAWSGQIIFMNQSGIYSVTSNGSITDISEDIAGLFFDTNRDQCLFDKSVFKTLAQTRSTGFDGSLFKFFLEDSRGFIMLLTAKMAANFDVTGSNMLVFNSRERKWYEFEGHGCASAESQYGKITVLGLNRATEDGVMRGTEKQLLITQGMTIDVPSLEKQVCQLKLYGEITPKTSDAKRALTVGQINDWQNFDTADRSKWTTNVVYSPETHETYFHKQRLNTSKSLVTSIVLESLETGSFTIEGMEIEGAVIQQGMKK